jgi:hypothetical protein
MVERGHILDIVDTWMWVRIKIPKGTRLEGIIKLSAETRRTLNLDSNPNHPFFRDVIVNYPYDTSFVMPETLMAPQELFVDGVTFMFDGNTIEQDRNMLRDNYCYRLWIMEKWFHQGPMRLFPSIIDLREWPSVKVPDIELPWIDKWETPNLVPSLCKLGISIEGTPFTLLGDLDFVVGIRGKLQRSVQ